jgi:hypothetical protein
MPTKRRGNVKPTKRRGNVKPNNNTRKHTVGGGGVFSKLSNYILKKRHNIYCNKILYYKIMDDAFNDAKNVILEYITKNNINTTTFYNKLIELMKDKPEIFDVENKKFCDILRNMKIVETIDEPYLRYSHSKEVPGKMMEHFILDLESTGELFVFGKKQKLQPTGSSPLILSNPALLEIINEAATSMKEKHH